MMAGKKQFKLQEFLNRIEILGMRLNIQGVQIVLGNGHTSF